jgi:hypothetical protein
LVQFRFLELKYPRRRLYTASGVPVNPQGSYLPVTLIMTLMFWLVSSWLEAWFTTPALVKCCYQAGFWSRAVWWRVSDLRDWNGRFEKEFSGPPEVVRVFGDRSCSLHA